MKKTATGIAVLLSGVALFFLSTFSFLALQGELNQATLVRLPWIGSVFETKSSIEEMPRRIRSLQTQVRDLRAKLEVLESRQKAAEQNQVQKSIQEAALQISDHECLLEQILEETRRR